MFTNPVVLSVLTMIVLCLLKLNVILSLIIAALVGGAVAGMPMGETISILIDGMGGNSETALSYILLGGLAAAIHKTGAAEILSIKIAKGIKGKKTILLFILAIVACLSGTVIPVHIAFIPILIPALIPLMNTIKMDRRAASCALAFGLKAPYLTLPIGYGLIFHGIVKEQVTASGMPITVDMVWKSTWVAGLAMLTGFIISIFTYRKSREYKMDDEFKAEYEDLDDLLKKDVKVTKEHYISLIAGAVTLVVQIIFGSLPLGAMFGIAIMLATKVIKWSSIDELMDSGIVMMGFIAFVMLVASGYAAVIRETGGIETLVNSAAAMMRGSKVIAAIVMLLSGLMVTMGIGTSFGTVPIIAAIYVPLALKVGFSTKATILLIATAAALGDASSPASDTTLGPTSGLNIDGQHDHIWDTCIPSFLHYTVPLSIFGLIGVSMF
ncbi:sodium:proton antiporter [Clostridium sp. MSJ-11]|uniref:Sodium:proton antiporter n=1 Tax=Clostridium mobile TaxID=2841512 RepID=A0ABS6ED44_9CLOT|nr:SLC13 family permease [Clostridium mobile]MBU5483057.1 sodium:proton antiporter [Clostridium mobile]